MPKYVAMQTNCARGFYSSFTSQFEHNIWGYINMGIFSMRISSDLKAFLEAEDLDGLMEIKSKLRQLNKKDIKKILSLNLQQETPESLAQG
ncbi:hypothetical protein [Methanosarcina sp. WWM596]|uniref:hypothetical protein n=2 Tax=unclassified Methanosarcina TaxID=2644672 RepID=UPI000B1829FC|nr:hypothetical protein [Methanosarcina sp. WWM596]